MIYGKLRIINKSGLHMRAAERLSQLADKFDAEIIISYKEKTADAKSAVSLLLAGIPCGAEAEIRCEGADEDEALSEISGFIEGGFGERELILKGKGVSCGIKSGRAHIVSKPRELPEEAYKGESEEKSRLDSAAQRLKIKLGEKSEEIARSYSSVLSDGALFSDIYGRISKGESAQTAVFNCFTELSEALEKAESGVIRLRACDIREIRDALIMSLKGKSGSVLQDIPTGSVIIMKEPLLSVISALDENAVSGIVCETGGSASHGAIIARARGIPAAFSVKNCTKIIKNDTPLSLDGGTGEVITFPDGAAENKEKKKAPVSYGGLKRYANIISVKDAKTALKNGAEGIGLFRTELLFMNRESEPTEEEQFLIYSQTAELMQGKEVIIRALDTGGDKRIDYFPTDERGIRFLLSRRDVFKRQTRAVMRAAAYGNVKYILPFVTELRELRETRIIIEECAAELEGEEKAYKKMPLGVMIETPSAALISDLLAGNADFFSIGTNDLTSAVLVRKREECAAEDALCQSVMRAVEISIKNAKRAGIRVGVCGAAAESEAFTQKAAEWGADYVSS